MACMFVQGPPNDYGKSMESHYRIGFGPPYFLLFKTYLYQDVNLGKTVLWEIDADCIDNSSVHLGHTTPLTKNPPMDCKLYSTVHLCIINTFKLEPPTN